MLLISMTCMLLGSCYGCWLNLTSYIVVTAGTSYQVNCLLLAT